jgi:hypothetical protein
MEKAGNQVSSNHVPNISGKNISTTLRRIWVDKAMVNGGAFGSKQSIFEALTNSSRETGEGFVSTELALGSVQ